MSKYFLFIILILNAGCATSPTFEACEQKDEGLHHKTNLKYCDRDGQLELAKR